jgi:hypothetical protein
MRRPVVSVVATLVSLASSATARQTADQTRLSIGLSIGASSGAAAWSISGQPVVHNGVTDSMNLGRRLNGSISAAALVTYFPTAHWGLSGEIALVGGRYDARCAITSQSASVPNSQVCASIDQSVTQSNSVAFNGGVLFRPWSRSVLSPFLSARAGLLVGSMSSIETSGTRGGSLVVMYFDPSPGRVTPLAMLGAGVTTSAGPGYQFRWEVRDIIMGIEEVTGPTNGRPQQEPSHQRRYRQRWTFLFGFEVVLDRSRGHRY